MGSWSIRGKLAALVGLAVFIFAILVFEARTAVNELGDSSDTLVRRQGRVITHMRVDMMHDALRADVVSAAEARTDEERTAIRADVAEHAKLLRDSMATNAGDPSAASAHVITEARPKVDRFVSEAERLVELGTQDPTAARAGRGEFLKLFHALEEDFEKITQLLENEAKVEAGDSISSATRRLMLSAILAAIAMIAMSLWIGRSIRRRVATAVELLGRVAQRDLSERFPEGHRDEIGMMGSSLNAALDAVADAFDEIRGLSANLLRMGEELSANTNVLASGAQQQAASLEETAASLEQITATIKQSAGNAQQASQLAMRSRETAERGGRVVNQTVEAMSEVTAASNRIRDIITTIDEIALQTNLLALNAAVEAARAGDQGRGFGVVAAEVGNLASRTAVAAKEVKQLIESTLARVQRSSALVGDSGRVLGDIILSTKQVNDLFGEIAAATSEQSAGVDQVNEAVAQMDRVTQQSSAQSTTLSQTASELAERAETLDAVLARFELPSREADEPRDDVGSRARIAAPFAIAPRFARA